MHYKTLIIIGLLTLASGCTTLQTTYFRGSFQPVEDVNDAAFYPYSGSSQVRQVADMSIATAEMYSDGYGMVGYSQFVSPLFTSLAPGYAQKYAATLGADVAVLETPRPGPSNLHGFLVTYWTRIRPETFGLGVYSQDLPEELLDRLGRDYNVVYLLGVVPGTSAHAAGLKKDDVVLAINGERITSSPIFHEKIRKNHGRETVISVSRLGELVEIPVDIGTPAFSSTIAYRVNPWERTAPTDWSNLSAANTTARVVAYQRQQREIAAAYERGRQQATAAQSYAATDINGAYSRYSGASSSHLRRSSPDYVATSTPHLRRSSPDYVPPQQWSNDFRGAMNRFDNLDFTVMKGDSLSTFFDNYPSVYGQLYSYPAGNQ